jgi:protein TonB
VHAAVLLALVVGLEAARVEPERIVRVQLLPLVEEAAPGPKAPEVVAPPPTPAPPPRPKAAVKPPATKPPPRPVVAAVPTPAPVAPAAPAAVEPAPAEPAGPASGNGIGPVSSAPPSGAGGRGAGGDELAAYVSRVRALLARHKQYPSLAKRRGLEGTVLVRLRIAADGSIEDARAESDAPQLFARSALDAIERAGRFPAPPRGALSIEVPMRFRLDDD